MLSLVRGERAQPIASPADAGSASGSGSAAASLNSSGGGGDDSVPAGSRAAAGVTYRIACYGLHRSENGAPEAGAPLAGAAIDGVCESDGLFRFALRLAAAPPPQIRDGPSRGEGGGGDDGGDGGDGNGAPAVWQLGARSEEERGAWLRALSACAVGDLRRGSPERAFSSPEPFAPAPTAVAAAAAAASGGRGLGDSGGGQQRSLSVGALSALSPPLSACEPEAAPPLSPRGVTPSPSVGGRSSSQRWGLFRALFGGAEG